MQLSKRHREELRESKIVHDNYMTAKKAEQLRANLERIIKVERPEVLAEVQRTREMGDLSENAGYQISKVRLRSLDNKIMSIQDRLKQAIIINEGESDGRIRIGSTVKLGFNGQTVTYQILGSQESSPLQGKISHLSPLGRELIGHAAGDEINVVAPTGTINYQILKVQ
jgi:transcription elongation factor GreA